MTGMEANGGTALMNETLNDRDITELLYSGDPQGSEQLDRKYRNLCGSIAFHILGNREDAEECANDALMKVFSSIPPERPAFLKAFTIRTARRAAIDRLRRRNAGRRPDAHLAEIEGELEMLSRGEDELSQRADTEAIREVLNRFLEGLPAFDRIIFVRRYWYMDSVEEIADRLQMTSGSVRGVLYRDRKKLKKLLKESEIDL